MLQVGIGMNWFFSMLCLIKDLNISLVWCKTWINITIKRKHIEKITCIIHKIKFEWALHVEERKMSPIQLKDNIRKRNRTAWNWKSYHRRMDEGIANKKRFLMSFQLEIRKWKQKCYWENWDQVKTCLRDWLYLLFSASFFW